MKTPQTTTMDALLEMYDGFLFDAFGVLVTGQGVIPGAASLIEHLNRQNTPHVVITNDATRSIETCQTRFRKLGLNIDAERIITSASLIEPYVKAHNLVGAPSLVLGAPDTHDYAKRAGLMCLESTTTEHIEVLVVGDFPQTDTLQQLQHVISCLLRTLDAGNTPHLLLPNPDLIYPKSPGHFGLTAGSIAAMITAIIKDRLPNIQVQFTTLGKPEALIYTQGLERLGTTLERTLMVGDQIATDIKGARAINMPSALVTTGLITDTTHWSIQPDYIIHAIARSAP